MDKDFLKNVYGYPQIKEELYVIREWYLNSDTLGDRAKLLPKGILFYGFPGEGKTHLMREYSKTFNYKVFVIEGDEDNVESEIVSTYTKAKEEKNAIVIIDELDKLIEKDTKIVRILQSQLDGFSSSNNVLTLATANDYYSIPEPILREGRFDRKFSICSHGEEEYRMLIDGFSKDAKLNLSENDKEELTEQFLGYAPSKLRSIMNNAYLRYGSDCSIKNLLNTADFLSTGYINKDVACNIPRITAIHEAGHALYIYKYCESQKFLRIYFTEDGGFTAFKPNDDKDELLQRMDFIGAALAGLTTEDIIYGSHSVGCGSDLDQSYDYAFRLINRTCIYGIKHFCTRKGYNDRKQTSEQNSKIFDRKASRFFYKQYKIVRRRLKKCKNEIIKIADYLMVHKEIKRDEFIKLLGEC